MLPLVRSNEILGEVDESCYLGRGVSAYLKRSSTSRVRNSGIGTFGRRLTVITAYCHGEYVDNPLYSHAPVDDDDD